MEWKYMRGLGIALVAALALGLAGCGGGGGGTADAPPAETGPTAEEIAAAEAAKKAAEEAAAAEAQALADARMAARDAWRAARAALAGIAGKQSADPASYQRAVDAVSDAKAAYDAALAAETSAEAMRHQEDAEGANEMAMAQVAMVIASYDAPRIAAARNAASAAADEAMKAYEAAKAALAAVESIQGMDMESYNTAAQKVADAKAAYDAAKAASDAAAAATLLADAQAQQQAAEDARDNANAANTDAMQYAGMVQTAEDTALASAQTAAQTAYDAAKAAYDAAKARVEALEADMDGRTKAQDNVADNVRAKDALARAKTAHDAAKAANDMAQAATLSTDAASHQSAIGAAAATVTTETAGANMYAGLVEASYTAAQNQRNTDEQNRMAEEQRVKDVAAARGRAMQSYMDADADATSAEEAAEAAEAIAADSPRAMAARAAATAAREAADAAKAAHDAIMDDMSKEDADAEATKAATAAGTANTQYMAAKEQNDAVQTAHQIAMEQQRVADVRTATNAASDAATAARMAAAAARTNATNARNAANDAQAAYEMAVRARTDSTNAKKHADDAAARATAAEEAATAAETAATAAETAHSGIDADGSAEDARTAQQTAEDEQGKAEGQRDMAMAAYDSDEEDAMGAMQLAALAEDAAGTHVLGLLVAANAQSETDADAREAAITAVAMAIGRAAGAGTGDADNDSSTTGGDSTSTATAAWPANTPATDDAEEVVVPLEITVTRTSGTNLEWRTEAAEEDDANTADINETIVTATKIDGLDRFPQGYSITDRGTHAIVFTDKDQDAAPVATARPAVTAREIINAAVTNNTVTGLGTRSGTGYTGVTFYEGTVDDNTDERTAFTGTLTCPSGAACSVETTVVADGPDTHAVTGYVFTGRRGAAPAITAITAAEQAAANDYLVFGVWLDADDSANNDGSGAPQVAAFAGGGRTFATPEALYGTARYEGSATGVYTEGTRVDYFQGDATLTANFGDTPDEGATDAAAGTVTGMIDNIVAGGESMSDVISLNTDGTPDDGNITATGGFAGNARMGDPMVNGDVVTYTYTGTWRGQFHGAPAATTPTDLTNTTTPPSAAGTFGVTGTDNMGTPDDMDDDVTRSYVGAFGAHKQQ